MRRFVPLLLLVACGEPAVEIADGGSRDSGAVQEADAAVRDGGAIVERDGGFADALDELVLDPKDREAAERFSVARQLRKTIEANLDDRVRTMQMALMLLEADLLLESVPE